MFEMLVELCSNDGTKLWIDPELVDSDDEEKETPDNDRT